MRKGELVDWREVRPGLRVTIRAEEPKRELTFVRVGPKAEAGLTLRLRNEQFKVRGCFLRVGREGRSVGQIVGIDNERIMSPLRLGSDGRIPDAVGTALSECKTLSLKDGDADDQANRLLSTRAHPFT